MRYKNYDTMLPARAFESRGSVVGGRSMRLHGGGDNGYYYYEPPAEEAPQPVYDSPGFIDPGYSGPGPSYDSGSQPTVDPGFYQQGPDYSQTVNDLYQQTFGRQADASGMATFTNLLNSGWTGEQVRNALTSSQEYQQQQAAQPSAPAPQQPSAPAAATPESTVSALYQQYLGRTPDPGGMATFTNLINSGWTPSQVANALTSSAEYQQINPGAQPTPVNQPTNTGVIAQQFHVETSYDQNESPSYILTNQNGQGVQYLTPTRDENGNITGYGIRSGGDDNYVYPIDIAAINQQAAQVAAAPPAFGAGEGKALGRPYSIVRDDGLPYKEFDAQGNLTRWRDSDWAWHNASDVKASGTEVLADGRIRPTYDLGGVFVMAPRVGPETGGAFAGVNWKMAASVVLMAVMAVAGPAIMAAMAGEAAAGGIAGAEALAEGLGMSVGEAVESGLISTEGLLTDAGAQFVMDSAGIAPEVAASVLDGTIPTETLSTAGTEVTNAYNTTAPTLSSTNPNDVFNTLVDQMTKNGNLPTSAIPGSETALAGSGAGTATDIAGGGALQNIPAVPGAVASTPSATTSFLAQAAKSAAINAGMTALQGGSPQDILKAAAAGIVGAGINIGLTDVMGNGILSSIASRAAASAGAAVVAGANPMKAALQGAVFATVTGLLPSTLDNIDAYKNLSQNTKDYIIGSLSSGISQAAAGTGTLTQGMLTGAIGTYVDKMSTTFFDKGLNFDPKTFVDDIKNTVQKYWKADLGSNVITSGPMAGYEIGMPIPGSETAGGYSINIPPPPDISAKIGPGYELAADPSSDPNYQANRFFDDVSHNTYIRGSDAYFDSRLGAWIQPTGGGERFDYNMPEGMREATSAEIMNGQAQPAILMSVGGFAQKNTFLTPVTTGTIPTPTPGVTPTPGTTPEPTPVTPVTTPGTATGTTPATNPVTTPVTNPGVPVDRKDNFNGTNTTTYSDGSTETKDNQTGQVIVTTPPIRPSTGATPGTTTGGGGTTPGGGGTTPGGVPGGGGGGGTGPGGGGGTTPVVPGYQYPIVTVPPVTPVAPITRPKFPVTFGQAMPLVNPGVNPGFIEPTNPYPAGQPGVNQYNWASGQYAGEMSDLANYNANAPAQPYGHVNPVGTFNGTGLIRPDQLNMASTTLQQQPSLPFQAAPQNFAIDPRLLNQPAGPVPGYNGVFAAPTAAQAAIGKGYAQQYGQGLNYVPYPVQPVNPATTPLTGQLNAAADAARAATPARGYYTATT
jgi:hypothetical protein